MSPIHAMQVAAMHSKHLYRLAHAAELTAIPLGTLRSAIEREEIPTYPTACGLPLVRLADIERWKQTPRRSAGRPPKEK